MNAKYRESVDFSFEKLEQNFTNIKKIDESIKKLSRIIAIGNLTEGKFRRDLREELQDFIWEYIEKLEDDFNMPEALSIFFLFITFANTHIDSGKLSAWEANAILDMYKTFNQVLSIMIFDFIEDEIPSEILEKFEQRNTAKQEKNFQKADDLRNELLILWYKIVDERSGSRVEKIK